MIPGIDVSHWQSVIDWQKVKAAGYRFAFMKATEYPDKQTKRFLDPSLERNAAGCRENNILFGAYHFFRTHISSVDQAHGFCDAIENIGYTLPPVLDLEAAGKRGAVLAEMCSNFLFTVESRLGVKPIIYTGGGFWFTYVFNGTYRNADFAIGYPLWIARYSGSWPAPLYPFAGWQFWQYSDTAKVPGVATNCDVNWFSGDTLDLARLSASCDKPQPEPEPEPAAYKAISERQDL